MRWAVGFVLLALTTGCGGGHADPTPAVTVTPSVAVRRLEPGTTVDLTATVTRVLTANTFVIADADLPVAGQLVVSATPVAVRVYDLVRLGGRVERFDAAAFARYGLADPQVYEPFGDVVIVAAQVHRYLAPSPSPSPS